MTALCGLARNFPQMFLARIGVGVGEAALSPAAYSIFADYFPPHVLSRALSVYSAAIYVGSGAALLEGLVAGARILPRAAPDPLALARLAQSKPLTPARPLYLRAPDAKLPGGLDPAVA